MCLITSESNMSSRHCRANIWQLVKFHYLSFPLPSLTPLLFPHSIAVPPPFAVYLCVSNCVVADLE